MTQIYKQKQVYKPNQVYNATWCTSPCEIKDGIKIVRIATEPTKLYNPFYYYKKDSFSSLYLQFASIDTLNSESILNFINKFGFLGLDIRKRIVMIEKELGLLSIDLLKYISGTGSILEDNEKLISISKNAFKLTVGSDYSLSHQSINQENLDDISYEIEKLKNILILIQKKDTATTEELYKLIFNASDDYERYFFEEHLNGFKNNTDTLRLHINNLIMDTINKEIDYVSPMLTLNPSVDSKFQPRWNTKTLISVMYTMLYLDLVQGVTIKECQNITCGNFFEVYGHNDRKIYCDDNCAKSNASRQYRKREKKKKEVQT